MKQIKNLLCGLLLSGTFQLYALPYSPYNKKEFISAETSSIVKDSSLQVFTPVTVAEDQQINEAENPFDRNPNSAKKRNRTRERQPVLMGISQTTGDILFVLFEVAIEIATQFCY